MSFPSPLPRQFGGCFRIFEDIAAFRVLTRPMEAPDFTALTLEHLPGAAERSLSLTDLIERNGSGREFARFSGPHEDGPGVVAMHYSLERPENGRFVAISDFLKRTGVPCPELHQWHEAEQVIWMEDLGDQDLLTFQDTDWDTIRRPLYEAALKAIIPLHQVRDGQTSSEALPVLEPPFDAALYGWEQDYFFEHFVENFSDCPAEDRIRIQKSGELKALAARLAENPRSLIHRDFQSSNVMIRDGQPVFIDYQGMRFGLPEYDLASLLFDPYVHFTADERDELAAFYFRQKQQAGDSENFDPFRTRLDQCAAQRLMQALGAYGNLGLNKGQPEFLDFIPTALERLREVAVDRRTIPSLSPILSLKES